MPDQTTNPVVAAIPGGGWLIDHREDDGSTVTSPVLAWIFYADGSCKPVDADSSGWCDDPTGDANFIAIYHPDQKRTDA